MATIGRNAAAKVVDLLRSPGGLNENLAAITEAGGLSLPDIHEQQIHTVNVAADLIERSKAMRYPSLHVYCEKVTNKLREKFRSFSGTASMAIEVRASQDRIDGIEQNLQYYVDAATRVLDQRRGDWGSGLFYTGSYEVSFGPVKHGGRNFLQTAVVRFDVEASLE